MVLHERLSLGPFEFEPRSGRLTKYGHRIKLQPKSAAILSCLLDHPGEVITREQLQKRLWPEGVHVDFELGIKVAVQKLRQALCDDASEPVYIQTIHGEGYRFIAAVAATADPPVCPVENKPAPEVSTGVFARRRFVWLAAAAIVLVMIAGATLLPRSNPAASLHFQDRDWIIIVPFENRTGDALLDGTMESALERALSESRYVNIAPRERIADALALMRQNPATRLSEDLARQVAVRDGGIKAVVGGRVEKLGSKYVLAVRLLNPENSQPVGFIEKTGTKEGLLEAAQSASDDLRRKLGEKSFHREIPANLEKATTASLAALRAFSVGMEQVNLGEWSQAAPLLEEAVLQDPQFATAHIYAAHTYSNLRQPEKAAPHYQAAFQLAPGVTQRERLFILGSYYSRFLNDYEQAIDAYTALVNLYPDDFWGLTNLISDLHRRGQIEDHIELLERLHAMRPQELSIYQLRLCEHYLFVRPDEAKARHCMDEMRRLRQTPTMRRVVEWAQFDAFLDLERVGYHWCHGEVAAAAHEMDPVDAQAIANAQVPGRDPDFYKWIISEADLTLGRLSAAKALCASIAKPDYRHRCFLRVAFSAGDRQLGRQHLDQVRADPITVMPIDVAVATWLGETALAKRWAEQGRSLNWELVRALLLLAQGRPEEAANEIRASTEYGLEFLRDYYLLTAIELQGKVEEASNRFAHFGHMSVEDSWAWPPARLKLAEFYRKSGRTREAEDVENEMRHYLSAADPDHPVLRSLAHHPAR